MSDQGDTFLREVEEAVRQERYKALWDKYGVIILVLAVLVVAAVAGHTGWTYWQERNAQEAGTQFTQALILEGGADKAKAQEMLTELAQSGPQGYRVLSRFQLAAAEAKAGKIDEAVKAYDALAIDANVDRILQNLATLQGAALRLDSADYAEMERRLKGLIDSNGAWRFTAREMLGLSAYRLNDMREAEQQFTALLGDPGTPPNLRERAEMMLALILGASSAPSAKTN
ncbi:MAG: tetratricopeptide repeat protein [Alphaproteobacteria bacterium]|nr:tetratricopeptide repeat protein [Alphaproteobacteria bacterium]